MNDEKRDGVRYNERRKAGWHPAEWKKKSGMASRGMDEAAGLCYAVEKKKKAEFCSAAGT